MQISATWLSRLGGMALCALALGACATQNQANDQTGAEVVGSKGAGSGLQSFDVRKQGRRFQVRVYNRGDGLRAAVVTARTYRGVDRGDARLAYDAAFEAAQKVDCGGAALNVLPETALFQEEGRRSAFTNGEAAWVFQARCG